LAKGFPERGPGANVCKDFESKDLVGEAQDVELVDYVAGLRAVTSTDGMTADFYPFDMKFLGHVATRIVNEVKGVNRVGLRRDEQATGDNRVGVKRQSNWPTPTRPPGASLRIEMCRLLCRRKRHRDVAVTACRNGRAAWALTVTFVMYSRFRRRLQ
jgi:GMP synthase C terminal domain